MQLTIKQDSNLGSSASTPKNSKIMQLLDNRNSAIETNSYAY